LQVAGVAQSVNVEGEAPLINRTDASLGNVIEENQIDELPIADRNVVQLLSLQPGVAYLGNQLDASTDTRSGAVNGMRSDQSNVTLDGIGVNDQNNGYAFTSVLNVPPDSVQEFRVTTANANADSGYSSGAQVALATKSGTNSFHGSAYEYNRNTVFSANDPFLKYSQLTSGESNTAPKLLRNVFGATLGGPIMKNRLFFFANYEGRHNAQGKSVLRTVPSATLLGFPITIDNGFTWATNWNIEGDAMPNGPAPKASNPKNAIVNGVSIGPDIFANPAAAEAAFRPEWPGESGVRNNVIGEGMFNIDTGVSKDFSLGEQRRLEFSWQAFNATNSVRYDVRAAQPSLSDDPTQFGKYTSTLTTPRFMQFALRLVF
jgi:hypothetical protein